MSQEEEFQGTPPDLRAAAENATLNLLPEKSKHLYENMYAKYVKWRSENKAQNTTENTILAFFTELSEKVCPTALWTKYSFLRSTIILKEKIDISKYGTLLAFIKLKNKNYHANQAKALTEYELKMFLTTAPADYFLIKVVTIFSLFGGLRCCELAKLKIDNICEVPMRNMFLVEVLDTKNCENRSFTIKDNYYDVVKHYLSLRPKDCKTDRLFLNYQHNTCTQQPVGKNKLAKMPRLIAEFLKLPQLEKYTGHSFRHTAATVASNGGADVIALKQLGGWKSSKVVESYVQNSLFAKEKISNTISDQIGAGNILPCQDHANRIQNLKRTTDSVSNEPKKKFRFIPKKPTFSQPVSVAADSDNSSNQNNFLDNQSPLNNSQEFDHLIVEETVSELIVNNQTPTAPKFPGNFIFNNCNITFQMNGSN